jgi:hypothetical protein
MLRTDLRGLWENCKTNKICQITLLLIVCMIFYIIISKYIRSNKNNSFTNVNIIYGVNGSSYGDCANKDIPKMDEAIIRNTIDLPNRNPALLTSSMVIPAELPNDEERRRTRMDILNMFYNSFDDDLTSIKARPQNLYIIP